MEKAKTFQDLLVWQKAHSFVLLVYEISETFPKSEMFGLTSQFRRASVSIAANIAEGFRKTGIRDKLRFYNIAQGSLEECRYFIILSKDLKYISDASYCQIVEILEESSKLLNSYCNAIVESRNYLTSINS